MQRGEFQRIIDDSIAHVEPMVQEAAGRSLQDFLHTYGHAVDAHQVMEYCHGLFSNDSASMRTGSAIALAAVPRFMVARVWAETLEQICRACRVETAVVKADADARVRALTVRPLCILSIGMVHWHLL
jgi:3-dehydroquinate synthetase